MGRRSMVAMAVLVALAALSGGCLEGRGDGANDAQGGGGAGGEDAGGGDTGNPTETIRSRRILDLDPDGVEILARGQASPAAIAVEGGFVYWANRGGPQGDGAAVMRVSVEGGEPTAIARTLDVPVSLALDGTGISWIAHGPASTAGIFRTGKAGGPLQGLADIEVTQGLATSGERVVWTSPQEGAVWSVGIEGGAPVALAIEQVGVGPIVSSEGWLYWGVTGGVVRGAPDRDPERVWSGDAPAHLAASAATVAWSTQNGDVWLAGAAGVEPQRLVAGEGPGAFTTPLATDGEHVYFADLEAGTVSAVSTDGGEVTEIASGQPYPAALAVDAEHVYWVDLEVGTVVRAEKAQGGEESP